MHTMLYTMIGSIVPTVVRCTCVYVQCLYPHLALSTRLHMRIMVCTSTSLYTHIVYIVYVYKSLLDVKKI